jgi:hypothetical protein
MTKPPVIGRTRDAATKLPRWRGSVVVVYPGTATEK